MRNRLVGGTRFEFGENWLEYLSSITEERIGLAVEEMRALIGDVSGKRVIDVGSGSGLHSLAALRLGAAEVKAIDYDRNSVEATRRVLCRYHGEGGWAADQADILEYRADEQYDVVYSWGVLHHTGAMWRAIDRARALCAPGGIFALALYVKTPLCGMWTVEKRLYAGHPWLRPLLLYSYTIPLLLRQTLATGNVLGYIREYKRKRGMSFMVDVKDWLGGYPYESVREEELIRDMEEAGFEMVNSRNTKAGLGLFGTGCGEWVFRRRGERA